MIKRKKANKDIIIIDPTAIDAYELKNNTILLHDLNGNSPQDKFYASYVHTRDIISGILEISSHISDEELQETIEAQAYEILNLDIAIEYKIAHIEAEELNGTNRIFHVFACDVNRLKNSFKSITTKIKFIDYIIPAPFLIKSLYIKNILESNSTECFVYFQKHDAFLTIYKNGKYLYSKSLNYSLNQINEKFCEMLGERIDEREFINLLINDGLNTDNQSYRQYLMQLFSEIFLYLNDVLTFFRRSYNVEQIDKIYMGSEFGDIQGIEEYSKSYLGIETEKFDFDFTKNKKERQIDQMHILLMLSSQLYLSRYEKVPNLTIFERPPPFQRRVSGQLTLTVFATLLIALAYPAYNYIHGYIFETQANQKQQKYINMRPQVENLRNKIKSLSKIKKQIIAAYNTEKNKLDFRKKLLNEIYIKKVEYPMKAMMFQDLVTIINKKNVHISKLKSDDRQITASLVSTDDKYLTELLREISKTQKYSVSMKRIIKEEKKTYYMSDIKMSLKRR